MPDWRILRTSFHSTSYEEFTTELLQNKSPGFGKKVSIPNMVGNADRFLDCFGFSVGCSHSSRLLKFMASGRGLVPVQEKPGNQDEVNRVKRRLGETFRGNQSGSLMRPGCGFRRQTQGQEQRQTATEENGQPLKQNTGHNNDRL